MKLKIAIIFSLLGHGILFMSWPGVDTIAIASTSPSYQVTLLKSHKKYSTETASTKTVTKYQPETKPKKNKNDLARLKKPSPAQKKYSPPNNAQQNSEIKAYIISRINNKIRNNFNYPLLAVRNGWEGKVLLSLFVNSAGGIENAQVKTGSGYSILDQSALNALLKIRQIEKTQRWFYINSSEIIIPVIYRLQKG